MIRKYTIDRDGMAHAAGRRKHPVGIRNLQQIGLARIVPSEFGDTALITPAVVYVSNRPKPYGRGWRVAAFTEYATMPRLMRATIDGQTDGMWCRGGFRALGIVPKDHGMLWFRVVAKR
jgi:hypothetical protein